MIACAQNLSAQESNSNEDSAGYASIELKTSANPEDISIGLALYPGAKKRDVWGYLSFDFRPFKKKLLVHDSGNKFFQYAERRYYLGGGVTYFSNFSSSRIGIYSDLNLVYTWAIYGGTNTAAPYGFVLNPGAGFYMKTRDGFGLVKTGYEYVNNQSSISGHRITASLILNLH